jgi:transcriptional regulator with XRE-family HTH domain
MKKNTKYYDKELLIKIRKTLNITQTQLAHDINKSKQYICLIENGKKNLTEELLNKIYERYEIDSNSFQNGNGIIFKNSTPIKDILRSKYNLTNDTINIFSEYLDSFVHLSKVEQNYAKEALKLMIAINKYIENK